MSAKGHHSSKSSTANLFYWEREGPGRSLGPRAEGGIGRLDLPPVKWAETCLLHADRFSFLFSRLLFCIHPVCGFFFKHFHACLVCKPHCAPGTAFHQEVVFLTHDADACYQLLRFIKSHIPNLLCGRHQGINILRVFSCGMRVCVLQHIITSSPLLSAISLSHFNTLAPCPKEPDTLDYTSSPFLGKKYPGSSRLHCF